MRIDEERARLTGNGRRFRVHAPGPLRKLLAVAVGAVLLVAAFVFSLVVFAIVLAVALLLWGYLWWKTRDLRKRMREEPEAERVIEGEVIRDVSDDDDRR